MPSVQHKHFYIAPNFRVSVRVKEVAVSRLIDIRPKGIGERSSTVVCVPQWLPLVIETTDGLLPLGPPEAIERDLELLPEAGRMIVLVLAASVDKRDLRLIRLVLRFLWERPYVGANRVKHLAHWFLSDYAEELLKCLHDDARLTTTGVCLAINAVEDREVISRTSAHRILAKIRHAKQLSRVCPSRRKKALYKAQRKLDWPRNDGPDEAPA